MAVDGFAVPVFIFELTTAFVVATVFRIVVLAPVDIAAADALVVAGLTADRREIEELTRRVFDVTEDRADDVSLPLNVRLAVLPTERFKGTGFRRPVNDTDEFERKKRGGIASFPGIADNDFLLMLPDDCVLGVRRAVENM